MQPQQQGQLQINDGTVLDPKVVKVMRAIRQVESGGSYDAVGDGGAAHGAFQYNEETGPGWKNIARQYLGDENAPMDKANQNKATYYRIKEWKDQGRDPEEIAALWNGASKDPQTGRYIYNNPEYGEKFRSALTGGQQQLGGTYQAPPEAHQFTPATSTGFETLQQQVGAKQGGFISDVGESLAGVGQGLDQAYLKAATGDINVGSGVLQGAGALAGGVGDVVDDTLTNLPVVGGAYEKVTEKVGQALGGAADATGLSEWFGNQSEEAQGNMGAVLDVVSVIPFFKALKYGKTGVGDVKTAATMQTTQKNAAKELEASLNKPQRRILDRANSRGLDPMGAIVAKQEYLPDVIEKNGKFYFETKEAAKAIQRDIDVDEKALQNLLESTTIKKPGAEGISFNINDIAATTIKDVMGKAGRTGNFGALKTSLTKYFDDYKQSMQGVEFVDLKELNAIKRDIRSAINFDAVDPTGTLAKQAKFDAGQSLMKQVEDAAKKAGVKGVKELNDAMGTKLTALDIIEHLGDGKVIKSGPPGLVKSLSKETPIVAGLVDYATRGVPSTPTTRLKRKRPLRETGRKGLVQMGAGLGLSGQYQPEQEQ